MLSWPAATRAGRAVGRPGESAPDSASAGSAAPTQRKRPLRVANPWVLASHPRVRPQRQQRPLWVASPWVLAPHPQGSAGAPPHWRRPATEGEAKGSAATRAAGAANQRGAGAGASVPRQRWDSRWWRLARGTTLRKRMQAPGVVTSASELCGNTRRTPSSSTTK